MREEREEREKREKREEREKREREREGGREGVIYNQINSFMENKISKSVTFQEVTWHTTFFNSHARKMEKSLR